MKRSKLWVVEWDAEWGIYILSTTNEPDPGRMQFVTEREASLCLLGKLRHERDSLTERIKELEEELGAQC
jgi:phosphoribosyl-dephospho-CoA transferase